MFYQFVVSTMLGQETLMVTPLNDLTVTHHKNLVSIADSAQAMGTDHNGPAFVKPVQILHDTCLVGSVERVGRLVKEDVFRVLVDGSGAVLGLCLCPPCR